MRKTLYVSAISLAALTMTGASPVWGLDGFAGAQKGADSPVLVMVGDEILAGSQQFIQGMAQKGIDFLSNDNLSPEQRKAEFRKLLRSSYDMQTIGRFALGPYWRSATKAQQDEYQKLFERMIVDVYSSRFSEYKGQKLEVTNARAEGDKDVIVTSYILPSGSGEKVQVDWRVRQKGGQYKVIDVIVAGVSMALTQRSDFASVIQRGGGDVSVLLEHLRG